MSGHRSFTLKSSKGRINSIITNCGVCPAFDRRCGAPHPDIINFNGLWDTGASGTVITKNVADKLNLKPIGKVKVFHANGESLSNVYLINLFLPNNVGLQSIRVSEGILQGFDLLIGMDIITLGDFAITNVNGNSTISFRLPSAHEIDFVKEGNPKIDNEVFEKVGNNDLCPCGSKKKYKYCHGLNNLNK